MKLFRVCILALLIPAAGETATFAQTTSSPPATPTSPPAAPPQKSQAELEKLVAPIALYPDPLLATLLPASAYPIEIVEAARFVKDTNNIAKLDSQPWDQNVKALARFPDVIAKMNEEIGWTSQLGQAFVADQKAVLDAIQALRAKAQQAGTLKSTPEQAVVTTNDVVQQTVEQQVVYVTNTVVQIQPTQPQVIYVPQYNPAVVYAPPPAYAYNPVAPLVTFGVGMAVGAAIANDCDWHSGGVYVGPRGGVAWGGGYHGDVDVDVNRNVNVNQNVNRSATVNQTANTSRGNAQKWQPDQSRRASATPASTPQARGWGGQASTGTSAARPPSTSRATSTPRSQSAPARTTSASAGAGGSSAFNNSGGGAQARQASARGSSSRGGGGFARGGGGRRR